MKDVLDSRHRGEQLLFPGISTESFMSPKSAWDKLAVVACSRCLSSQPGSERVAALLMFSDSVNKPAPRFELDAVKVKDGRRGHRVIDCVLIWVAALNFSFWPEGRDETDSFPPVSHPERTRPARLKGLGFPNSRYGIFGKSPSP